MYRDYKNCIYLHKIELRKFKEGVTNTTKNYIERCTITSHNSIPTSLNKIKSTRSISLLVHTYILAIYKYNHNNNNNNILCSI